MHPFERVPQAFRRPFFAVLAVAAIASSVAMARIGAPLQTDAAPMGIVSYEFAWDGDAAAAMIASWQAVRGAAATSLIVDYGYLAVYSCAIAMGCILAGNAWLDVSLTMGVVGRYLAWGQWAAALFDGIENAALLAMLWGTPTTAAAQVAFWFAAAKFALIILGLLYALSGVSVRFFRFAPKPGAIS